MHFLVGDPVPNVLQSFRRCSPYFADPLDFVWSVYLTQLLQVGLAVSLQISNYRIRLSISQILGPQSETVGGGKFW